MLNKSNVWPTGTPLSPLVPSAPGCPGEPASPCPIKKDITNRLGMPNKIFKTKKAKSYEPTLSPGGPLGPGGPSSP